MSVITIGDLAPEIFMASTLSGKGVLSAQQWADAFNGVSSAGIPMPPPLPAAAVKPPVIPAPPSPANAKFEIEKQAAEVLANTFNQAFADPKVKASTFEIQGPVTTSVKTNKGTYATAPLFMGQKFGLSSAYVGKKNDVILVFNPKSPLTQYAFMEMKLDAAINNLDPSFKNFISDLSKNGFNISKVDIKTPADLLAAQNQQRMTDPRFGAW